jgi:phytoene dehydrogenase-like protein
MVEEHDIIVVGGGVGSGLPAAAYLQKAGKDVAMIEERLELGTFDPSTEYVPDVLNSPHASINFTGSSPIMKDLNLEDHGFRLRATPVVFMDVGRDGECCGLFYDPEETKKSFAKHSEKDGETIKEIQTRLLDNLSEYTQLVDYTPYPHAPDALDRLWELSAEIFGYDVSDFEEMNGFELLEETFESDWAKRTLMTLPSLNLKGDPCARGQGACLIPMSMTYFSGQAVGGNHSLVHAIMHVFREYGGTEIRNSLVEEILIEDDKATGVRLADDATHGEKKLKARDAVISATGTKVSLDLVGEDVIKSSDPQLYSKMKYWKNNERSSTITHWVLDDYPQWQAADSDERVQKAHLTYRSWDSWEHCKEWNASAMADQDFDAAYNGLCENLCYAVADPSQASEEGHVAFRTEVAVPWHGPDRRVLREDDPGVWDEVKDELAEKRNELFGDLIKDFDESIIQQVYISPLDIWRFNRSAPYGQVVGGDFTEDQWVMGRMPYRAPIDNLYFARGTWPLTLTWCANGYNCASIVAEDLNIRDQGWWDADPWEWFMENQERITVDPTWT